MAPWFNLILDSFVKYSKKEEAFTELGEAFDGFSSVVKEGPESLATWVECFGDEPFCFLITGKNKRTVILHHLMVEENRLVGLSGFQGIAPPKSFLLEEASGHLTNPSMAKSILESKLPTLDQMIKAKNVSGLLNIRGESEYDIASMEKDTDVGWTMSQRQRRNSLPPQTFTSVRDKDIRSEDRIYSPRKSDAAGLLRFALNNLSPSWPWLTPVT